MTPLTPAQAVLNAFHARRRTHPAVQPDPDELAQDTGLSLSTVRRALDELLDAGRLRRLRSGARGLGLSEEQAAAPHLARLIRMAVQAAEMPACGIGVRKDLRAAVDALRAEGAALCRDVVSYQHDARTRRQVAADSTGRARRVRC